jgi:hypothetical protein
MQMLGSPGMLASRFVVPSLPVNAKRETNRETLERLELDLILIGDQQLSAADSYRFYGHDAIDHGFWGCGVVHTSSFGDVDIRGSWIAKMSMSCFSIIEAIAR